MNFMKKSVKFILDNGFCNLVQTIKREKPDFEKYQQKGETFWKMVYLTFEQGVCIVRPVRSGATKCSLTCGKSVVDPDFHAYIKLIPINILI